MLLLDNQDSTAQTTRRPAAVDTSRANRQSRRLLYSRWNDRPANRYIYTPPRSSLYLKDPKSLSNDFQMDTTTRMSVYERVGTLKANPLNYRNPLTMSYEDFQKLQDKRVFDNLMRDYSAKQDGKGALGARGLLPKLDLPPGLDRIFGSNLVDFKPNGFVLLDIGYRHVNNQNPLNPIVQRRNGSLYFDEQININFNGKIGENLGLNTNWDTKSSFNFENQVKLDFRPGGLPNRNSLPNASSMGQNGFNQRGANQGGFNQNGFNQNGMGQNGFGQNGMTQGGLGGFGQSDFGEQSYIPENESIIQRIQAGNVNWQLPLQLIPSVQNLRGIHLDLRFGRLNVGLLASQQLSRQQCMTLRGGAQNRQYELRADNYDENRHFFLSHFFRENYERWLSNLPMILSGVTITRVEVYVTNRNNNTDAMRNVVGFSDLGESKPYRRDLPVMTPIVANAPVNNKSNGLFDKISKDTEVRQADRTTFAVESRYDLRRGTDYDMLRGARKLTEREFKFHPELGYISLLTAVQNDDVLAVAYEYTLNGQTYQVGELTEDYQSRRDDEVLVLKLLRSATIRNNTRHPLWDLMMKNIYALNTSQLSKQNFQMRVIYKDDLSGIDNPHLQEGRRLANVPLLRVMGLDKLNPLNDPVLDSQRNPIGDGNFDFIEGVTVDTRFGRLIFPTLEPFGASLAKRFDPDEEVLRNKYVFDELYRTTQIDAQQITEKNKFFLKGTFQGSAGGATIQLPFGVSEQSIIVRAGGVQLQPGADFMVEGQGAVRITNESVLNSGRDIEVCYEQPDLFNNQIRTTLGTRLEYTVSSNLRIGMTAMRMRETPPGFLSRAALGNDPINNSVIGADINFRKESRFLTRMLDALPLIQTKEPSAVNFQGEVAQSFAGLHPKVRNRIIVDDFEAARTQFDLTRQPTRWRVGGTPLQFPQGTPDDPLAYAYNRAKMSAYTIDISFSPNAQGAFRARPTNITADDLNNVYERLFTPQEIFQGRGAFLVNLPEATLDVAYYPKERGIYNYNTDLDSEGNLKNPRRNFGAITRAISADRDFDNTNVEILEFWLMNPFHKGRNGVVKAGYGPGRDANNTTGGKLFFTLGEASEDIVKNGRYDFENGLPTDEKRISAVGNQPANVAESKWGYSPRQQFVINAFTNEPEARAKQDVGLDGLNNAEERTFFRDYLQKLPANLNTAARRQIEADPSNDDFEFYLSPKADSADKKIVARYKNFMGMENNTPEFDRNTDVAAVSSILPDGEDLNQDNTINDQEGYYEYELDLRPDELNVGKPYIVDKVSVPVSGETVEWYLFRVPVREFTRKVGDINGFKSIRFIRMYMTDWEQPVVLRFAQLQLVATQYRKYVGDLNARGLQEVPEPYDAQFKIATVSAEENSAQTVTAGTNRQIYAVPPGWERDVDFTTINQRPLNEQAMSLCVTDLRDGDARAAFKNVQSTNLLFRKRLKMFVHMHKEGTGDMAQNDVTAFMRLGTDVSEHFYEIEVTNLQPTPPNRSEPEVVWPQQNEIDVEIGWLIEAKAERDRQTSSSLSVPYTIEKRDELGRVYRITVVGRPDLSNVLVIMMGMRNPRSPDQQPKSFCIWVNELHVSGFENQSGIAAVARADIKLADIATIQMAGKITTFGFGAIQQKPADRSRDNIREFSLSAAISADKFLPERWGFKIPLYVNYDLRDVTPHFNPFDPDMPLKTALEKFGENDPRRQQLEYAAIERAERRGFNFTNVRKTKTNPSAKRHLWDIENFAFTYAFNEQTRRSSTTSDYTQRQYRGGIIYQYGFPQKPWQPFQKAKNMDRPYLELLKEFNLNLLPSQVAVRYDVDRSFISTLYRSGDLTESGQTPFYEKYFLYNRNYDLNWNLTKSIVLTYSARANAVVDEPIGMIDTQTKRDSIWRNFRNFGRMKNYDQDIKLTYRIPLDKIPLLDWMTADYSHRINYQYQANSLGIGDSLGISFGNIARNSLDRNIRGKVDFVKLYNKIRYLNFANRPSPPRKNFARSPGDDEDIRREPSRALKNITRLLMAVRGIDIEYNRQESTTLPGFLPSEPKWFGNDLLNAPRAAFILGSQNPQIIRQAAENNWLSRSTQLNNPFLQTRSRTFSMTTRVQPFKDFNIQIQARMTREDDFREWYRPNTPGGDDFMRQSAVRTGNFQMSFMSFKTAFAKFTSDNSSPIFDQFKANREVMKARLEAMQRLAGREGNYDLNSQDVLIPAFFAAYNGKDPNELQLDRVPFRGRNGGKLILPMPNWRLDYNGLSQLPFFKKIFSSFSLEHSYQSTYSVGNPGTMGGMGGFGGMGMGMGMNSMGMNGMGMNGMGMMGMGMNGMGNFGNLGNFSNLGNNENFTSALDYGRDVALVNMLVMNYPQATLLDENKNFMPVYVMRTISLRERFSPLIGIRARTVSKMDLNLSYNQERNVSLNLSNSQVAEVFSRNISATAGFTRNNVRIPFRINGEYKRLKNDLQFRCTFAIQQTRMVQRPFEGVPTGTSGMYTFQLRPQLDYTVSKLWSLQLYFDRNFSNPYTLNAVPISNTRGGIQVRFNVAEL